MKARFIGSKYFNNPEVSYIDTDNKVKTIVLKPMQVYHITMDKVKDNQYSIKNHDLFNGTFFITVTVPEIMNIITLKYCGLDSFLKHWDIMYQYSPARQNELKSGESVTISLEEYKNVCNNNTELTSIFERNDDYDALYTNCYIYLNVKDKTGNTYGIQKKLKRYKTGMCSDLNDADAFDKLLKQTMKEVNGGTDNES